MRTINRYIGSDFLASFIMTLLVFTFVMTLSAVVKAIDLLARGVSGAFILKVFAYNIPFLLTFSIPISVLTTVLLLFGRLSFDGELTAMRACGLTLWQILAPIILASIGLTFLCLYLNSSVAPRSHFARRQLLFSLGMEQPINLLEEGRFVRDFPGLMVYVGKKSGHRVEDVVVYELGEGGIERNIRARRGEINIGENKNVLIIDLFEVRIDQPRAKENDPTRSQYINAQHYPVRLDMSEIVGTRVLNKKTADMTYPELLNAIRRVRNLYPHLTPQELGKQRMSMVVEASKRLALSLSCFAFVLLGAPLGMISKRKESSAGVGISLLLVFFFYFFIILANSLVGRPDLRPDLIVWLPIVGAEMAGFWMVHRAN
ncbi:MAG: LptF/LptG family permease [Verrucomicrobia bacterium]|nr:LptF/LptG family permease [Verrucomicrobiota bacterium]MBU1909255.1 LptF/LptG family permease [Verrucomicrobiota bacterium]